MIDTKLLRQKILDLAIRGKLVPQTPADEPASELLKKIKAEKEELVKAGKIKKDKHESFIFKGDDNRYYEAINGKNIDITEEIAFDIPDSWCWCRLRTLASTALGKMLDKHKNHGIPMPYLRNVNVRWGIFDLSELLQMRFEPSETERYSIKTGDLVVCEGGEPGRCAVWTNGLKDIRIQKALHRVRPYNGISSLLLSYIFRRYAQIQYIDKFFTGSTIKHLTGEALNQLLIILPPVAEQQRIVSQIKALLKYVDEIDRESETLEKFITLAKQKILDLAIRGKLVPQDPSDEPASELLKKIKAEKEALVKAGKIKKDKHESFIFKGDDNCYYEQLDGTAVDITDEVPFDLPGSWSWCRFSTLVNFVMGKTPARSQKEYWDIPFLPWVSIADMVPGGVIQKTKEFISSNALSHCFSGRISPAGTLIMSFKLTIGRVSILNMPAQHNEAIISIFPLGDKENIHRDYLLKILPIMVDFVKKSPAIKGNTLNSDSISKMLIPLPPLAEQKKIVARITQYETILKSIQE